MAQIHWTSTMVSRTHRYLVTLPVPHCGSHENMLLRPLLWGSWLTDGSSCCPWDSPTLLSQSWASLGLLAVTEQVGILLSSTGARSRCLWRVTGLRTPHGLVKTFLGLSWSLRPFLPAFLPSLSPSQGSDLYCGLASPCLLRSLPFPLHSQFPQ